MADDSRAGAARGGGEAGEKSSLFTNPVALGYIYQGVTLVLLIAFVVFVVNNALVNIEARNVKTGLRFLGDKSGFDLSQSLIAYTADSPVTTALLAGLFNTLLVSVIGIILASLIGLLVGIGRLSTNWLVSRLATAYVEVIRNVPLLLQLFLWYFGVLAALPTVVNSLQVVPGWVFLNKRGLTLPTFTFTPETMQAIIWAFVAALVLIVVVSRVAKRRQEATGQILPVLWIGLGLLIVLPVVAFLASGAGLTITQPKKGGFNIAGGVVVLPELLALVAGLSIYTASYIAETVRAGILAVSYGQIEAARALGLQGGRILRLVVLPQALRVIIPPLTNQYLNLAKNSSLAAAIGYPDLVYVGQTVFGNKGHEIEIVGIWMMIYLGISLITSFFMNWYNRRIAIVER